MMKAKCVKGNCGYEFENNHPQTFFDTVDEGENLFEIDNDTYYVKGYVFCPICGAKCTEVKK